MLLCIVTGKYLSIYCKQKLSRGGNLNRLVYFCDGSLKEYAYSNLKTLSFMLLLLSIRKINELGLLLSLSYELTAAAVIEFVISCILVLGCCVLLAVQERMFKSE